MKNLAFNLSLLTRIKMKNIYVYLIDLNYV